MIRIRNLSYAFPGGSRAALRGLDFRIESGEIFGILGPSGSGKTVLIRILAGLIRDYQGEVSFRDKEYGAWSREFYERIGVSLRAPAVFRKLSAEENLSAVARLYRGDTQPVGELLRQAGLVSVAKRRAVGLAPGMRKRLDLARALAHRPDCLIADEPLAGLNEEEAALVKDMLAGQKRAGRSVVLASSDASLIHGLCDRWIVLAEGAMTEMRSGKDA
jgi:fluoroquinolone transport system ATP-binding protein